MKKIIVPIDFSIASKNALNYAMEIAPVFNCSIEVVHVYSGLFNTDEQFIIRAGMGRPESLMLDIDHLINTNEKDGSVAVLADVEIKRRLVQGSPTIELEKLSKEEDCEMIVISMTGLHRVAASKFFGSVATHVARNAACPVVLVPKDATFKEINHLLFASNYESVNPDLIREAVKWTKAFGASVHFIHIEENELKDDFEEIKTAILDTILEEEKPSFSFEIKNLYADSVGEGLHDYIEKKGIDLAVMVAPKKSFFEHIFHKSRTKEMAFNTNIPLMVLHGE